VPHLCPPPRSRWHQPCPRVPRATRNTTAPFCTTCCECTVCRLFKIVFSSCCKHTHTIRLVSIQIVDHQFKKISTIFGIHISIFQKREYIASSVVHQAHFPPAPFFAFWRKSKSLGSLGAVKEATKGVWIRLEQVLRQLVCCHTLRARHQCQWIRR